MVGIGSVLDQVPNSFSGTILGAGLMWASSKKDFSKANCQLVRGKLSVERCKGCDAAIVGDPGLLAGKLLRSGQNKIFELGLIPHYVDATNFEIHRLAARYPQ